MKDEHYSTMYRYLKCVTRDASTCSSTHCADCPNAWGRDEMLSAVRAVLEDRTVSTDAFMSMYVEDKLRLYWSLVAERDALEVSKRKVEERLDGVADELMTVYKSDGDLDEKLVSKLHATLSSHGHDAIGKA